MPTFSVPFRHSDGVNGKIILACKLLVLVRVGCSMSHSVVAKVGRGFVIHHRSFIRFLEQGMRAQGCVVRIDSGRCDMDMSTPRNSASTRLTAVSARWTSVPTAYI